MATDDEDDDNGDDGDDDDIGDFQETLLQKLKTF